MIKLPCPVCHGDRLKPEVLGVTVNGLNISETTALSIDKALTLVKDLNNKLSIVELQIATLKKVWSPGQVA
jgi:excinuclease ABC subunit A